MKKLIEKILLVFSKRSIKNIDRIKVLEFKQNNPIDVKRGDKYKTNPVKQYYLRSEAENIFIVTKVDVIMAKNLYSTGEICFEYYITIVNTDSGWTDHLSYGEFQYKYIKI